MPDNPVLMWFRQDLRLADNPALSAACKKGPVFPVFVWAPEEEGNWPTGGASRYWLHQSLDRLSESLRNRGSRLVIRRGPTLEALLGLAKEMHAGTVCWNRRYEPAALERDAAVEAGLRAAGIDVQTFNGSLLFEPWEIATKQGRPYQVFTRFWDTAIKTRSPEDPLSAPVLRAPKQWPATLTLDELELEPKVDWAQGIRATWDFGEEAAIRQLEEFLDGKLDVYMTGRDRPAEDATSRLSPHLHFGEISPRQVWHAVHQLIAAAGMDRGMGKFLQELGWREFSYHLLYHFPHTPETPLRPQFEHFPWSDDDGHMKAWQKGETGFPIVDAGMRELWHTGWMHNRVRMIAASFLVKDLLVPWQAGTRWFWDTLVDADLANNTQGWQWVAGCGADAAPYFRIFNPVKQGEKFDRAGAYVRQWVPELAELPDSAIHCPWTASESTLEQAGVRLGETYPRPIVDHGEARRRALDAYQDLRR